MRWFGPYWPSAFTWSQTEDLEPIERFCTRCGKEILGGDQGIVMEDPREDELFAHTPDDWSGVVEREKRMRRTELVFHRRCLELSLRPSPPQRKPVEKKTGLGKPLSG